MIRGIGATILVLLAAAYGAILFAVWAGQDAVIFPGWDGPTEAQVAAVPGLRETVVPGEPPLRAWVRPADPDQPTLIVFHGNRGLQWPKLTAFAERGWGILMPAYRGFAGNAGTPSEAGLLADGHATLAHAARIGLAPDETVIYGESLGSGVAAAMGAEPGAWRGVVLDAPYTSVRDRAAEALAWWLPARLLIRHDFDTARVLPEVTAPILIMHGTEDRVIPVHHGRALAALAPGAATLWVEGDDHFLAPEIVAPAVADFLAEGP